MWNKKKQIYNKIHPWISLSNKATVRRFIFTCHPCQKASSRDAGPAHTAAAPAAAAALHAPS